MTRTEAFERFKATLADADLSPSDRYRIHIAACEYASAAAQEMLTDFDRALRPPVTERHGMRVVGDIGAFVAEGK